MSSHIHPEGYLPRIIDRKIERYLNIFGAIEIAGAKWCGKTWTALAHASSVSFVDRTLALARDDPSAMLIGEQPHVIDEWQRVPAIWGWVRHECDRVRGRHGAWILTGSSTPIRKDADSEDDMPSHSGAGRIARMRMWPMSLAESGDSNQKVSLAGLFRGEFEPVQRDTSADDLVRLACRGGWPEALDMEARDAQVIAREYISLLQNEGIPRLGKSSDTAGRLLFAIARSLGQAATYKTLAVDMDDAASSQGISEATLASYLDALKSMYLVDEIPGWMPPSRSPKRVRTKPKRYLADPSLAVAILGMSPERLFEDWQTFGTIFENLCMRDLMVYASALETATGNPVRYYRDDSGLEADAIVELSGGTWAAFEFKTSERKVDEAVGHLKALKRKLTGNPASRTRPPEFTAVITGVSEYAREVDEGIYVIPLTCLTA